MTTYYVDNAGSNTAPYDTWAKAAVQLQTAVTASAAGDTIYVAHTHAETAANSSITLTCPGTESSITRILCVNTGTGVVATTATVTRTSTSDIFIYGYLYCYGITFKTGSGGVNSRIWLASNTQQTEQHYEQCAFQIGSTATSSQNINIGTTSFAQARIITWTNCYVKLGAAGSQRVSVNYAQLNWSGGGFQSGTATPDALIGFNNSISPAEVILSGLDLSNVSSTAAIFDARYSIPVLAVLRNSKLPASWTGTIFTGTITQASFGALYNCDDGSTNYRLLTSAYHGSVQSETVIVRTGGASDGTTPLSWKMTSSAANKYPIAVLKSPEIVQWNETTGSSITATIEVITDNVTLTDTECWLEVEYLGTSGNPLSLFVSDAAANVLATPVNQTTSTEAWTTTGLTTPTKQKFSVTFTPQHKGFIHAVVKLAKASTTVYVDPKLTVA
jgi:hypothetical protein